MKTTIDFRLSKDLQKKAHALIPGGCHTYAKGDDQFPEEAPGFIARGEGSHVWDLDGNEFIEYGMGLRSVVLGHGYRPVAEAAYKQMLLGTNFTRPAPVEVECAEELLSLISGGEMVKFGKNGSDATTAAVKLARAYTGRDLVAVCSDQPFFSTDDWFMGTTPMAAGIPEAIRNLTVLFRYNDLGSLQALFDQHPNKIACIMMEAEITGAQRADPSDRKPAPEYKFLHAVQALCKKNGAVFILDETITGFRWDIGGAQACYEIVPDLSIFGKAIANGFALSALVGKREIMELGGLDHKKERVFLLSLTHGAETHALAAAVATLRICKQEKVVDFLYRQGERLTAGVNKAAREHKLTDYFQVSGKSPHLFYVTMDQHKKRSQEFRTLFLQETLKRGLLMPSLIVSFSHQDEDIDRTLDGINEALYVYARAINEGVEKYLKGRPVKPVFRTFN